MKTFWEIRESVNEKRVVDTKAHDAYKKHCKSTGCDDDSVRMCVDNPNNPQCKKLMKDKNIQKGIALYKKAMGMKEDVSEAKEFKPHMMYDPKTGKEYKANKPEDHERMSKMGYTHEKPDMKEAMTPAQKAAHAKAIADFKKRGGKVTKLPPGKAAGYHGKEDPGHNVHGVLGKSDSSKFKPGKKIRSMR